MASEQGDGVHGSALGAEGATLVALLRSRAGREPERRGYTFLLDGERDEAFLTYGELDLRARSIAASLRGVASRGERALLLYPPGLDYVAGFFGCLYAGVTAVPIYPPDPLRLGRTAPRLSAVCRDARATAVLTTGPILAMSEALFEHAPELGSLRWLATDGLFEAGAYRDAGVGPGDLAFLQYTSGSTAEPKGVMLSHENLINNLSLIKACFGSSAESCGVIWLPPYHDMGLIGGILQPLYAGLPVVLMSPVDFLRRPMRWLEAVSRYRATISGGPDFAYDLCARKATAEGRAALDLSSWDLAFNGAEPVRAETIDRFCEAFAPSGFRREAFYPCYGLAEGTLISSGGSKGGAVKVAHVDVEALREGRGEPSPAGVGRALVSSGRCLPGHRLVVVDPETRVERPEGRVGEIWLAGPSVALGYWGQVEATEEAFGASLAGDRGGERFLRTGDLGFLAGGELYVTGRSKDLIIIRGKNHYPTDVERSVERAHPSLRPGCGAAFSVEVGGEERLVVAYEVDGRALEAGAPLDAIARAVRGAVASEHDLQAHGVALLRAGGVPKTSSGKVRRRACRAEFLAGGLDVVHVSLLEEAPPSSRSGAAKGLAGRDGGATLRGHAPSLVRRALGAVKEPGARRELLGLYLRGLLARALRAPEGRLDADASLYAFGLDSLTAVELRGEIEADLGVELPLDELLRGPTLEGLSGALLERLDAPPSSSTNEPFEARSAGPSGGADAPLSAGQQALWFLHQLAPDGAAYHVPIALRVLSALDRGAFVRALGALVARHPALRTTFHATEAGVVQRVGEGAALDFEAIEAGGLSGAELDGRLKGEAGRPFDLERGPLLRVRLFSRSPREHVALVVMHHIVTDFWSLAVLAEELDALYSAECGGRRAELPAPARPYADFARWQAARLSGRRGEALERYWREALAGELPELELPTDRPRPPSQTFRGGVYVSRLGAPLSGRLKGLARSKGVTLALLLQAGFQALLYRYTGQTDFALGVVGAGRERAEFARTVGYFAGPVVVRARPSASTTFAALLAEARDATLGALAHQDYPFNVLVERLKPPRDPGRTPFFQVMFAFQRAHRLDERGLTAFALDVGGARAELGGLTIESMPLAGDVAQFDLTLTAGEAGGGLVASFQYNSDLFDEGTIARLSRHFEALLGGVVDDPDRRLGDLPMLDGAERAGLLEAGSGPRVALPDGFNVPELFAAQAGRTPDGVALAFKDERLTYGELGLRAGRLASWLRGRGVGPGALVGLCLERSVETVAAALGVLWAGAAYVPLDPGYPRERLALLLGDSGAGLVLTQSWLLESLSPPGAWQGGVVCLDRDVAWGEGGAMPPSRPGPRALACLVYTSGSTGAPKGVMLEHGGLANLVRSFLDSYLPGARDRIVPLTSPASASFVGEILPLLCCGGALVMPTEGEVLDAEALYRLLVRHEVSIVSTVPAMLARLGGEGWPPSLRLVLSGGEALAAGEAERLIGTTRVANGYGLTETTVCSTYQFVDGRGGPSRSFVPVGRPVVNTRVYVLDAEHNLLPAGCVGGLYVAGAGLARGYRGRPALTAERFLPDPFGPPGGRMYETGDLGRFLPDGALEYVRRADAQVKLRGHRVELGEIEAALGRHPGVRRAAVLLREDAPGDKRLVAYLVADGEPPARGALHAWLSERLPPVMVPSAFVPLDALPLSPNGKIDLRALPSPGGGAALEGAYAPPQSAVERRIAAAWQEALKVDRVGVHDNFFELGGNSLLIARVHRRLRDEMRADLTLVDLFKHPTVSALARHLGGGPDPRPPAPAIGEEAERRRAATGRRERAARARRRPGP